MDRLGRAVGADVPGQEREWAEAVGDALARVEKALRHHRVAAKAPEIEIAATTNNNPTFQLSAFSITFAPPSQPSSQSSNAQPAPPIGLTIVEKLVHSLEPEKLLVVARLLALHLQNGREDDGRCRFVKDDGGRSRTTSKEKIERGHVALLPHSLTVEGTIALQEKHRSLYKAHLYPLNVALPGTFEPNFIVMPSSGCTRRTS